MPQTELPVTVLHLQTGGEEQEKPDSRCRTFKRAHEVAPKLTLTGAAIGRQEGGHEGRGRRVTCVFLATGQGQHPSASHCCAVR